jgi:hypothetical protein
LFSMTSATASLSFLIFSRHQLQPHSFYNELHERYIMNADFALFCMDIGVISAHRGLVHLEVDVVAARQCTRWTF